MKCFAVRVIALYLTMSALIGGVVSYSRAHAGPNPLHTYGLDVCDGKPCFMGITPGVTSWDEALSIWNEHDPMIEAGTYTFSAGSWRFAAQGTDTYPRRVAIIGGSRPPFLENDFPQIANVLIQYGTPCGVEVVGHELDGLILRYPSMLISADIHTENRITTYSAIASITLIDTPISLDVSQDYLCNKYVQIPAVPWQGFTSLDRYRVRWVALPDSQ